MPNPDSGSPLRLLRWLLDDDLDAALDAGLMDYRPAPGDEALDPRHPDLPQVLLSAQRRLRDAWAARARHRARARRLARIAAEREARRLRTVAVAASPTVAPPVKPELPAAVAAALARAQARAATRKPE